MDRPDLGRLTGALVYLVVLGILGVFMWSGMRSERGLSALAEAEAEAVRLSAELAAVHAERAAAENRVRRLSEAYLDLDLLDERVRSVLGHARDEEIVLQPVTR